MSILNNPFDPSREAALVTGAGNGIGRAIAQALVGEGVRTIFADVREDTVAAAAAASLILCPIHCLADFRQASLPIGKWAHRPFR